MDLFLYGIWVCTPTLKVKANSDLEVQGELDWPTAKGLGPGKTICFSLDSACWSL